MPPPPSSTTPWSPTQPDPAPDPGSGPGTLPRRSLGRNQWWALIATGAAILAVVLGIGLNRLAFNGSRGSGAAGGGQALPAVSLAPQDPTSGSSDDAATADASGATDASGAIGATSADPSVSPSPGGTSAAQQAAALDALLDGSAAGRGLVGPAVLALSNCDSSIDPAAAAAAIGQATQNRTDLLGRLQPLAVDALTNGQHLKDLLQQAWTDSLEADRQYQAWAEAIASGSPCSPRAAAKLAGDAASTRASRAKSAFAADWNASVAGPLQLTPREEKNL